MSISGKSKTVLIVIATVLVVVLVAWLLVLGLLNGLLEIIARDLGGRDWSMDLPNGFRLDQINGKNMELSNEQRTIYIRFAMEYCIKDGLLYVMATPPDREADEYYIIELSTAALSGPYTKDEFKTLYAGIDITWQNTLPMPPGATYPTYP